MAEPQERGLFSAVVAVAAGLELGATLRRIVQSAVDLVDASYGALGVLGPDGQLTEFVHVGIDQATQAVMQSAPGLGRHHAAAVPHQQRCLKLLFERMNLPAQSRLRYAQRLGGPADIAMLHDR